MRKYIYVLFYLLSALLISACGGGGGDATPQTDLQVSSSSLTFSAESNGSLPAGQFFDITWSRADVTVVLIGFPPNVSPPSWLDINLLGTDSPLTATFAINSTALQPRTYTTTIRVVSGNSNGDVIDIVDTPLSFTVLGPAVATPNNLGFAINEGETSNITQTVGLDRDGTVMTPSSVTIPAADDWLQATIIADEVSFGLTANAASLVPGYYQSSVTINYTGSGFDIAVSVALSVNSKQVNFLTPHVGYTSVAGNAIIRGHGFSDLTNPDVLLGTTPATSVTVVSDSEIRIDYPALAAGNYNVVVQDTTTTMTSIAELVIVDTPSYNYTSIPRVGGVAMLLFDPKREVVYLSDSGVERELERYQFNGTSWDVSTVGLGLSGINIALSNNFDKLIKLDQGGFTVYDPVTFTVADSVTFSGTNSFASPRSISFSNEGLGLINTTSDSLGTTVHAYNFFNDGMVALGNNPMDASSGTAFTSSLDGSRVFLNPNFGGNVASYYDSGSGQLIQTTTSTTGAEYGISVDQTGSRLISNDITNMEVAVYDGDLNALGVLPPLSGTNASLRNTAFAISPDGTRAYAYLGSTQFLHVLDLTTSDGSNGFVEVGSAILIPDGPDFITKMIISQDGGTLFLAGEDRLIVQPVP